MLYNQQSEGTLKRHQKSPRLARVGIKRAVSELQPLAKPQVWLCFQALAPELSPEVWCITKHGLFAKYPTDQSTRRRDSWVPASPKLKKIWSPKLRTQQECPTIKLELMARVKEASETMLPDLSFQAGPLCSQKGNNLEVKRQCRIESLTFRCLDRYS